LKKKVVLSESWKRGKREKRIINLLEGNIDHYHLTSPNWLESLRQEGRQGSLSVGRKEGEGRNTSRSTMGDLFRPTQTEIEIWGSHVRCMKRGRKGNRQPGCPEDTTRTEYCASRTGGGSCLMNNTTLKNTLNSTEKKRGGQISTASTDRKRRKERKRNEGKPSRPKGSELHLLNLGEEPGRSRKKERDQSENLRQHKQGFNNTNWKHTASLSSGTGSPKERKGKPVP